MTIVRKDAPGTPPQHALLPKQRLKQTVKKFIFFNQMILFQKKQIQKFICSRCIISNLFTSINNGTSAFHCPY